MFTFYFIFDNIYELRKIWLVNIFVNNRQTDLLFRCYGLRITCAVYELLKICCTPHLRLNNLLEAIPYISNASIYNFPYHTILVMIYICSFILPNSALCLLRL